MKPRVPSTPEQAVANVQLESEFNRANNELRRMHNEALNELRLRRVDIKEKTNAHVQAIKHQWNVERTNLRAEIDKYMDERGYIRSQLHDGFTDDFEPLRELTEKIRVLRLKIAEGELDCVNRVKDAKDALNAAIAELDRERIELQDRFQREHTERRMNLAEKVSANRERAWEAFKANFPEFGKEEISNG